MQEDIQEEIPKVEESSGFNLLTSIWLVPFIALIIASWLAYQYFSQIGPEIRIVFPVNEGLIAGQSVVKFRNVPVGKVTKILVQEDGEGVVVYVRMNEKSSNPYLTEKAKFWIVKPEVGISGISGLDTLISGTYINIESSTGGEFKDKYIGLIQPYRDSRGGGYVHLQSPSGDNVSVGTPIYYKNIKVGQVEYVYLSQDGKSIDIIIFIDKEYISYVDDGSKFWIKNIVTIDMSQGSINLNFAPLHQIVQGGIMFSSSLGDNNSTLRDNHIFTLYSNKTEAEKHNKESYDRVIKEFILFTHKSISNLKIDSPIRFDGFDIGKVKDIKIFYDNKIHKLQSEIIFDIDTSIFVGKDENISKGVDNLYSAIKDGLRANIDTLNIITKMQFIDLIFDENITDKVDINSTNGYDIFPLSNKQEEDIMKRVSKVLDGVDEVIENSNKLIKDINKPTIDMLKDIDTLILNLNKMIDKKSFQNMPDELDKMLKELNKTLKTTQKVIRGYSSNSLAGTQLSETLKVITNTTIEMKDFLKMLNRKPNALIFGDK